MPDTITAEMIAAAKEAIGQFERRTRDDGRDYWMTTGDKTGADWVWLAVRDAHGGMLPDDYRYDFARRAFEAIAEAEDGDSLFDFANETCEPDPMTGDLLAWLASHGERPGYCDEAMAEFGGQGDSDDGIVARIALGQYAERREVFDVIATATAAHVGIDVFS